MGSAKPGQVAAGSIRKQAEQVLGSKTVCTLLPWSLLQLLAQVPAQTPFNEGCDVGVYNE